MTIQEAIKSGKPFRRANEVERYKKAGMRYAWYVLRIEDDNDDDQLLAHNFSVHDILATDWEVKPRSPLSQRKEDENSNSLDFVHLDCDGAGKDR
jgi:hypothetical protein